MASSDEEDVKVIEKVWAVRGGRLKKDQVWLPPFTELEGKVFIKLTKTETKLAKYVGLVFEDRSSPWKNNRLLDYLVHLRNLSVERSVISRVLENDPLGSTEQISRAARRFAVDALDPIIDITIPALEGDGDTDVSRPEYNMAVLVTCHKFEPVQMELTEANLQYLVEYAATFQCVEDQESEDEEDFDLGTPDVKWYGKRKMLITRIKKPNGKIQQLSKSCMRLDTRNAELWLMNVRSIARRLQAEHDHAKYSVSSMAEEEV